MYSWNPWHGCHKLSAGCQHCYVYRGDARRGKISSVVEKTKSFDLPVRKNKKGEYTFKPGNVVAMCFTSDFFVEDADEWRKEAWDMIRTRHDLHFFVITKRIDRFHINLPDDWGEGYTNVTICVTVENQDRADYRLPIFRDAPIRHKMIVSEPLLGSIDFTPYLGGDWVKQVTVGGESGKEARPCNYDWVLDIRRQCIEHDIPFQFRQTGANFIKDGKTFNVNRKFQHQQARKAGINYKPLPVLYTKEGQQHKDFKIHFPTSEM